MNDLDLEARLKRLEDREAITSLVEAYGKALDWLDAEALDTIFFDDAHIDYGSFVGGGAEFTKYILKVETMFPRRFHLVSQISLTWLSDDLVKAQSCYVAGGALEGAIEKEFSLFFGRYLDRIERRNGGWGIAARKQFLSGMSSSGTGSLANGLEALHVLTDASVQHHDFVA